MRPEETCDLILSTCLKEGASDTVATVRQVEEVMIRFSNNEITVTKNLREDGASIYVSIEGRNAWTDLADLSKRQIVAASRKLVSQAKRGPASSTYAPLPRGPFEYDVHLLRQGEIELEPSTLVGWVEIAIDAARSSGAERVAGSLIARNTRVSLRTSGGACGNAVKPSLEISLRAFAGGNASGHAVGVSSSNKRFDPEAVGREGGELARRAKNPVEGKSGTYDALLSPLVFADVASQVGTLSSAFYVEAGLSFLADKLGERVASESFTLVDDPTLPGAYGSAPFDAEGLPTRRKTIIEDGVLTTYLHNSTTAKRFGTESTANAGLVVPHPFNLVIEPGDAHIDNMIGQIDRGIYVTNDWYLRYQNWRTGDFSMIPRDAMFLIERGDIKCPIRDLRISDNMLRMYSALRVLSRERRWIKWWEVEIPTLAPAAVIEGTRFSQSTM